MLAARGARDMGNGVEEIEEEIEDAGEVAFLKKRAKGIYVRSLFVAAILTGMGVLAGEILNS